MILLHTVRTAESTYSLQIAREQFSGADNAPPSGSKVKKTWR